jgi:hypothetical protein
MSIKLLCLDGGFYSVPIIRCLVAHNWEGTSQSMRRWLKALNFSFLMPVVIRGKTGGTRALLIGRKSYATDYTLNFARNAPNCPNYPDRAASFQPL